MQQRQLSAYEQTQLSKYGVVIGDDFYEKYGEMPVELITGHVEFCGLDFLVNSDVLIPRIETELLVDVAFKELESLAKKNQPVTIVEVGTGSGAVAICLGTKLKSLALATKIFATEISQEALEVAKQNYQRLLDDGPIINFLQSDLLMSLPQDVSINLLIANLPYIPTDRIGSLDSSVKDFEPRIALDGGPTGFELIEKLLHQAKSMVVSQGMVLLEIDFTHDYATFNQFSQDWQIEVIRDDFSKNRFAKLIKK